MRDTQRGSQNFMEKRRGRRERGDQDEMTWNQKRTEQKLASITSLCPLHSLDHSEMFTELYRKEKREEGDRGGQQDKGGNQKERDISSQ